MRTTAYVFLQEMMHMHLLGDGVAVKRQQHAVTFLCYLMA
jgi:hypothetical protein